MLAAALLWDTGMAGKQIARVFNWKPMTFRRYATDSRELFAYRHTKRTDEMLDRVRELDAIGMTTSEIAKELGICPASVRTWRGFGKGNEAKE